MKSILISIQPKWCELIASRKKKIEVRKTRPKIETPFKVYIYQTKNRWVYKLVPWLKERQTKVIGEFICDEVYIRPANTLYYGKGKEDYLDLIKSACMTEMQVLDYMGGKFNRDTYFWHISDLKIYDKPKELDMFRKPCSFSCEECGNGKGDCSTCGELNILTRPPQSWCYVEELQ